MKRWTVSLPSPDGYDIQPFDTTFHIPQEIVLAADHDAEIERLREGERAADAEIERLRALYIETAARHEGELIRRDEKIRRLRIANGQWERACNGYKEVIAEQDKIINNREDK